MNEIRIESKTDKRLTVVVHDDCVVIKTRNTVEACIEDCCAPYSPSKADDTKGMDFGQGVCDAIDITIEHDALMQKINDMCTGEIKYYDGSKIACHGMTADRITAKAPLNEAPSDGGIIVSGEVRYVGDAIASAVKIVDPGKVEGNYQFPLERLRDPAPITPDEYDGIIDDVWNYSDEFDVHTLVAYRCMISHLLNRIEQLEYKQESAPQ